MTDEINKDRHTPEPHEVEDTEIKTVYLPVELYVVRDGSWIPTKSLDLDELENDPTYLSRETGSGSAKSRKISPLEIENYHQKIEITYEDAKVSTLSILRAPELYLTIKRDATISELGGRVLNISADGENYACKFRKDCDDFAKMLQISKEYLKKSAKSRASAFKGDAALRKAALESLDISTATVKLSEVRPSYPMRNNKLDQPAKALEEDIALYKASMGSYLASQKARIEAVKEFLSDQSNISLLQITLSELKCLYQLSTIDYLEKLLSIKEKQDEAKKKIIAKDFSSLSPEENSWYHSLQRYAIWRTQREELLDFADEIIEEEIGGYDRYLNARDFRFEIEDREEKLKKIDKEVSESLQEKLVFDKVLPGDDDDEEDNLFDLMKEAALSFIQTYPGAEALSKLPNGILDALVNTLSSTAIQSFDKAIEKNDIEP